MSRPGDPVTRSVMPMRATAVEARCDAPAAEVHPVTSAASRPPPPSVVCMLFIRGTISVMLKDRDYDVTPHIILILSLIEVPQIRNGSVKEWEV